MIQAAAVERGYDYIVCGLCRRQFRAISNTHLIRVHHFDPDHPIRDYMEMFGVKSAECEETRENQIRSYQETLERQGKLWTAERVLREIRRRALQGEALNPKSVAERAPQLMLAGRGQYGSWRRALEAAGMDPEGVCLRAEWSREKIVGALRKMWDEGRPPRYVECNRRGDGLAQAARRAFGRWETALVAAGIDPQATRRRRCWTEELLFEEIRKLDPVPTVSEIMKTNPGLLGAVRRRWGTWALGVEAAGRECPRKDGGRRKWTREAIVNQIQAWAAGGQSLQPRVVATTCGGIWSAARREFGCWGEAVRAAGVQYAFREKPLPGAAAPVPVDPAAPGMTG